jgi:hypothetical protein
MLRSQGLGQPPRQGAGLKGERALLVRRQRREGDLLRLVSTALQHVGGELMPLKHPTDAPVIDGIAIAVPDNPRQFALSEGWAIANGTMCGCAAPAYAPASRSDGSPHRARGPPDRLASQS